MLKIILLGCGLLLLLIVVVLLAVLVRSAKAITVERGKMKQLKRVENVRISTQDLMSLTHNFADEEDKVLWADRQHIMFLLPAVIISGLAVLGFLILAIVMAAKLGAITFTVPAVGKHPPKQVKTSITEYLWVAPVVVAGLLALLPLNQWLYWRAVIRHVTNLNFTIDTQPWRWAFWLWGIEKPDRISLYRIEAVVPDSTFLGRVFGYGTITLKTLMQQEDDYEFKEISFVRDFEKVAGVIDEQRLQAVAASAGPDLLTNVRSVVRREVRRSSVGPRRRN